MIYGFRFLKSREQLSSEVHIFLREVRNRSGMMRRCYRKRLQWLGTSLEFCWIK